MKHGGLLNIVIKQKLKLVGEATSEALAMAMYFTEKKIFPKENYNENSQHSFQTLFMY